MSHESLVGRRVVEVRKVFDYIQIVFEGGNNLNVYGPYRVSGHDFRDSEINKLLRSLIGVTVERVEEPGDQLILTLSYGQKLSVDGNQESDSYEFFSSLPAPKKSEQEAFIPSMELTDAFNASEATLRRLERPAEAAMNAMGFVTKEHRGGGDVKDGNPYYEWKWVLSKDTAHGVETYRRTLTVSYAQKTLSPYDGPVIFSWTAEIFQKAQLSWYLKSGHISSSFENAEQGGFEKNLQEASAQAEAALEGRLAES